MPTDINWPIFSSRDILRSCLSAHLTASLLGFEEYGLTSGFLAETGLMNRVGGAKHKTAISRNEVIAFLVILPDFNRCQLVQALGPHDLIRKSVQGLRFFSYRGRQG